MPSRIRATLTHPAIRNPAMLVAGSYVIRTWIHQNVAGSNKFKYPNKKAPSWKKLAQLAASCGLQDNLHLYRVKRGAKGPPETRGTAVRRVRQETFVQMESLDDQARRFRAEASRLHRRNTTPQPTATIPDSVPPMLGSVGEILYINGWPHERDSGGVLQQLRSVRRTDGSLFYITLSGQNMPAPTQQFASQTNLPGFSNYLTIQRDSSYNDDGNPPNQTRNDR